MYIGMKMVWIWFQGEFHSTAYPNTPTPSPTPRAPLTSHPSIPLKKKEKEKRNEWKLYVIIHNSSALLIHV